MTASSSGALYVSHIHTNWKHDDPIDLDLGPRVLLVGPNGSGKSAVYEAVELALTGAVSNYSGRATVKDSKRLWRAKPKRHKALWIKLTLSDGRKVEWRQERSNGRPKWSLDGEKLTDAPIQVHARVNELRAELFGSAQRAEKFLTGALGLGNLRILRALPEDVRDLVRGIAGTRKPAEVLDTLRKMEREAKAEAKAAEQIERELEHHAGIPPTDEEIAETRERLAEVQAALTRAREIDATALQLRDVLEEWQTVQGDLIPPTPVPGENLLPLMEATLTMLRTIGRVLPDAENCPCCQQAFNAEARTARAAALTGAVQGIHQARSVNRTYQTQQDQLARLKEQAARLKAALPESVFARVVSPESFLELTPKLRLETLLTETQALLDDQQARRVSSAAPTMARQRAEAATKRAASLKAAADAWEAAQSQVVETALDDLVSRACEYFPERFGKARIKLRPSVDVGVDRAGTVGSPSGAEEATLMLALAAALSDYASPGDYDLLVMEDRAVDPQSAAALLSSLSDWSTGQLFVQAVEDVGDVAGWTAHRFARKDEAGSSAAAKVRQLTQMLAEA